MVLPSFQYYVHVSKERDEFAEKINSYTSENERLQRTIERLQRGRHNVLFLRAHSSVKVGFGKTSFVS